MITEPVFKRVFQQCRNVPCRESETLSKYQFIGIQGNCNFPWVQITILNRCLGTTSLSIAVLRVHNNLEDISCMRRNLWITSLFLIRPVMQPIPLAFKSYSRVSLVHKQGSEEHILFSDTNLNIHKRITGQRNFLFWGLHLILIS